jgi:CheY-like chemotaxis protein
MIHLIHWNEAEAEERSQLLINEGFDVNPLPPAGSSFLKDLESEDPQAILIDLSRLPSQGRDLAISLRKRKGTRHIPIVFVGGDPIKVEKIREVLPDAIYGEWEEIKALIEQAGEQDVEDLYVPDSVFAAYAGKPLAEKLGVKKGFKVAYINADGNFLSALGELPPDVEMIPSCDPVANLTIWFVNSQKNLESDLDAIISISKNHPVWIAWPKKGSRYQSDLTQQIIRQTGLDAGMVDYKICSIDQNWSALIFKWRGDMK